MIIILSCVNVIQLLFCRTDVCLMIIKDNRAMSSLDAVKRLSDVKAVRDVLNKYGAIEPGVRIF